MRPWIVFSIVSLVLWGFWGIFTKLAAGHLNTQGILIYGTIGSAIGLGIVLLFAPAQIGTPPAGIAFAVFSGLCVTLGTACYAAALARGPASVVVTLTALYPVVTIILAALFLHETPTARQALGMVFALAAMVLFAA